MHRLLLVALSTLALFSTFVLSQGRDDQPDYSNKALLYPNGLSANFSLGDYIQSPAYTASYTGDFSNCDTGACNNRIENAYNVNYSDGDTVKVCLCDNPVMPLSEMANKHGVVPKAVRDPVVGITSASVGKGGGAYAYSGINSFFESNMSYEVFVHEAAHIFDNDYKSKTAEWYNAITADTCVPDDYSKASKTEDYAQVVVTWSYMVLSGNTNDARFNCLSNQLNYVKRDLPASTLYPPRTSTTGAQPSTTGAVATTGAVGTTGSVGTTTGSSQQGKIACTADWQCPTYPRAFCSNGFCECHYGFTNNLFVSAANPSCGCATEPVWKDNVPFCLKRPECLFDWNCGWPVTCQVQAGQTIGRCAAK